MVTALFQRPAMSWTTPTLFLLVVVTALAERTELHFDYERASAEMTLIETAVTANLLLLPGYQAIVVTVAGLLLAQASRRRSPLKIAFNAGQTMAATAGAIATLHLLPSVGPEVAGHAVVGTFAAMVVYAAVNLVAFAGLLSRLTHRPVATTVKEYGGPTGGSMLGNASVGVLLALLWSQHAALVPLLLVPAAAMHLAYRGFVRTQALLSQVRLEHERLDRIVLGASDGIVLLDADRRVEVWNDAMEQITGVPADAAVGADFEQLLLMQPVGDEPVDDQLLRHPAPSDVARVREVRIARPDGSARVVREHHTFLFDGQGRPSGDIILVHDVTKQREVESMKGDFVARVSHELRTPLTPIRGFAKVLLKRGDELSPERRRECLAEILARSEHMSRLVEDLLVVARMDSEQNVEVQIEPEPVDLAELVRHALSWFRHQHADRTMTVTAEAGVPIALADPLRVQQIVTNLLTNAGRYTPEGSPIEVLIARCGDQACITVRDEGPGIAADQQEAIFERFHRLEDPLRMRTGGVGLGLFIARRLAEAMHGTLTVDSRAGEGAAFTLRLPVAPSSPGGDAASRGRVRENA